MDLQFSVAARNRQFSKAMRRIEARLQPLFDAFRSVTLEHPIHQAILVLITDEKDRGFIEEIPNNDGFFQVLAGCSLRGADAELTADVFAILQRAAHLCPFATPDHQAFSLLFERFRPIFQASESQAEAESPLVT